MPSSVNSPSSDLPGQMDMFREPILRQVAPDRYVPTDPDLVPDVLLCKVIPLDNGEYTIRPFREDWIRMCNSNLKLLGLANQRDTLVRLGRAGFVEVIQASPGMFLLNLTSWYNHLRRVAQCEADGESFWEPGKGNRELYLETLREWR